MTTYEVPLDDVDTEKLGGFDNPRPGRYHGQITAVEPCDEKLKKFWCDIEILAGTTANQEGKSTRLFLNDPRSYEDPEKRGSMSRRLLTLAIAVGLTTKGGIEEAKKQRRNMSIDWSLVVGRQLCFEIESNDQTKSKISVKDFGYWHLDDPKASDIPRNTGMLAKKGDAAVDPFEGSPF